MLLIAKASQPTGLTRLRRHFPPGNCTFQPDSSVKRRNLGCTPAGRWLTSGSAWSPDWLLATTSTVGMGICNERID